MPSVISLVFRSGVSFLHWCPVNIFKLSVIFGFDDSPDSIKAHKTAIFSISSVIQSFPGQQSHMQEEQCYR